MSKRSSQRLATGLDTARRADHSVDGWRRGTRASSTGSDRRDGPRPVHRPHLDPLRGHLVLIYPGEGGSVLEPEHLDHLLPFRAKAGDGFLRRCRSGFQGTRIVLHPTRERAAIHRLNRHACFDRPPQDLVFEQSQPCPALVVERLEVFEPTICEVGHLDQLGGDLAIEAPASSRTSPSCSVGITICLSGSWMSGR